MIKDKIYITDRQAFIEWKRNYTTYDGKFYAKYCGDEEPKSYPCILLDMEAQKVMLKFLIKEHKNKAETLRNMVWVPNFVNGTDELHFNKWKSFSIAANKKALNELIRQSKTTIHQLKKRQKELTQLQGVQ